MGGCVGIMIVQFSVCKIMASVFLMKCGFGICLMVYLNSDVFIGVDFLGEKLLSHLGLPYIYYIYMLIYILIYIY